MEPLDRVLKTLTPGTSFRGMKVDEILCGGFQLLLHAGIKLY